MKPQNSSGVKAIGGTFMLVTFTAATAMLLGTPRQALADSQLGSPGQLMVTDDKGHAELILPLKRTSVEAQVSGFGARVFVTQTFTNPSKTPIEAVYTFPLPADAAVDSMEFKTGDRVITGLIKPRDEARQIYNAAKAAGQMASLLDQERPNIFTQSIANIMPGATVQVRLSYVQVVKFEEGTFEFSFPMTVGPRYLKNAPDAGKIDPPRMRTGSNIDLMLSIDAGAPITDGSSVLHEVNISTKANSRQVVQLKRQDEIPNRDFIYRYQCMNDTVQPAFITHFDVRKGHFMLALMPPKAPAPSNIAPREVIFVMDQSGSQGGFPIEKSKELTKKLMKSLRPGDTFNVLGFSNGLNWLWKEAAPFSPSTANEALSFVQKLQANGGTELRQAVEAALGAAPDPSRLRLVVFNTDGFVGDEPTILASIKKKASDARLFTFGIGNGVNRYLIDGMAELGRGDAEYVTLAENADSAADRFIRRTQSPILTDVKIEIEGVEVTDLSAEELPDVFSEKPILLTGRYEKPGPAVVKISGLLGGHTPWSQTMNVQFGSKPEAPAVASLWARRFIERMSRDLRWEGNTDSQKQEITQLAMNYSIMSEFTSFVAVESKRVNIGGKSRLVQVPVEMTDGVFNSKREMGFMASKSSAGIAGGGRSGAPTASPTINMADLESDLSKNPLHNPASKIDAELLKKTGNVEVMIWMDALSPEILEKLKKAGLKVADSDAKLKVVFGEVAASKLLEIAKITEVQKIKKLSN